MDRQLLHCSCQPEQLLGRQTWKSGSGPLRSAVSSCRPFTAARRRQRLVTASAEPQKEKKKEKPKPINPLGYAQLTESEIALRSEAEAPFRIVRLVFSGFFVVSASVAGLVGTTQLIGALGGARNALPLQDVVQGLAIDAGAIALFSFLFLRDKEARDKQIARISREERLGDLQLELGNKRTLRMQQLRSFVRPVIVAGSAEQVSAAIRAAEPFKDALVERGVLVIPVPCFEEGGQQLDLPPLSPEDLRWRATPLRLQAWRDWFTEQSALAGKTSDAGLYVGLRLDGRVRASGRGCPPWDVFAKQLPPASGMWTGFMDGFDGRMTGFD